MTTRIRIRDVLATSLFTAAAYGAVFICMAIGG